ncbi:MAG: sodium:solute symporter family protein [Bacteroidales bacterium]
MHWIDVSIFGIYMLLMLSVGVFFHFRNKDTDDFFVGGRTMGSWHVGLSVVATDVGGGFSIGLGGLGFIMGLSGSWMLFTGLLGAWISAVVLIPRVSRLSKKWGFLTFPQMLNTLFSPRVALVAGIISAIGYIGFTSSQILAGAKLASAAFIRLDMQTALIIMGVIAVLYTSMGGLKAVIYTDTIQWALLMSGLILIGIPIGLKSIGGIQAVKETLSADFLKLNNLTWQQMLNWLVTILPIWFVGMTLYQRIYSTRTSRQAQKAWFIAGLFEYPLMSFMGVTLGLFARVGAENGMFAPLGFPGVEGMDGEMGLPLLLRTVLPVGLMGLMMSAYFSAIMSTADSCLMAASGNVLTDIMGVKETGKRTLRYSQILTLVIGALALWLATSMENVLELMLYSYAFMVSGLFVPVLGGLFLKGSPPAAALWSMMLGGGTTLALIASNTPLPWGLDANIFGITVSMLTFAIIYLALRRGKIGVKASPVMNDQAS